MPRLTGRQYVFTFSEIGDRARAAASQAESRGFESRLPLQHPSRRRDQAAGGARTGARAAGLPPYQPPAGSVRSQGSLASARRIRGIVRGRCWRVPTGHPRPRRSGRGAPRSAPGGSADGPAGGASTSGPAPRAPISRTRPPAGGAPGAGVSAIRAASRTTPRGSSSAASRSATSRSAPGSAASPRCSRIGGARSGAATPAAPGPWTRPTCTSPGAGALSIAPSTARGGLLDSLRSAHRDTHAARRVLRRLVDVAERTPQRVTTEAHPPDRWAIRWILGRTVRHRCNQSWNNRIEQDHRAVKQRSRPMLGFGSFASAVRCCSAFDALRQDCRVRQRRGEQVPLAEQRRLFVPRWRSLIAERQAAEWAPRGERLARFVPAPCDLTEPRGQSALRTQRWGS